MPPQHDPNQFNMKTCDVRRPLLRGSFVLCVLMSACQPSAPQPPVVGIYWDLVATGTGRRLVHTPSIDGHAKYSFRFTPDSVYHYLNATEREVIDIGSHGGDFIYSHTFTQRNDSLFFDGGKYRIVFLSRDSLVLSRGASRHVYTTAREQQKVKRKLKK